MSHLTEAERQRRKAVLKMLLKDLDQPVRQPFLRTEEERRQAAINEARQEGREVLTPRAVCKLFGKSAPTVRRAVSEGHVWAQFTLNFTAKPVALIHLKSAISYWGNHDPDLLERMRENGHVLGVDGLSYNVLSPTPLVTLRELKEAK